MSGPPYMRLWVDDYLTDTLDLDAEESGAYWLLLLHAWKHDDCSLPDNDTKLARIARVGIRRWKSTIRPSVERYFDIVDGRWSNPKQRNERAFTERLSETKSRNSRARWDNQDTENKGNDTSDRNAAGDAAAMRNPESQNNYLSSDEDRAADAAKSPVVDPCKEVFDLGCRILQSAGHDDDRKRRAIIGRWRKQVRDDDPALLSIFARCLASTPADPVSWITAAIKPEKPHGNKPRYNPNDDEPADPFVRATLRRQAERAASGTG